MKTARPVCQVFISVFISCAPALAAFSPAETAILRGVIHDAQHRPIPDARITIQAAPSVHPRALTSDANGEFHAEALAPGAYTVSVLANGFEPLQEKIQLQAGKSPLLHLQLEVAGLNQTVEVTSQASRLKTETSTAQTYVSSQEIEQTPGADQANSLAMITDFTPGAYMVHDMLHMRGGHQVNWFFDGIPVINTNIAANIAPLIDPKDVAELQTERGGYSSEYGDRTYGFFNVVTPSGFDRDNAAELIASAGNFYSTDDQFNIGSHTARFAYYASVDGNRSELGLATPVPRIIHDQDFGAGGFLSLLYNPDANNQFRWIASLRGSDYQVPNTPGQQSAGIRDADLERDDLIGFNYSHSFSEGMVFMLAPYFHFNRADYVGGPNDTPYILNDNIRSSYFGGRFVLQLEKKKHNAVVGAELWAQHDNSFFGLMENPSGQIFNQRVLNQLETHWANSDAMFAEDQYKVTSWLTLDLGLRLTHYDGLVNENAADPRLGAAVRIPRLNWIVRGYYAYYYQPPPLDSLQGPSLQFAVAQGYGFIPLQGERDIQHDFGLTIPIRGWALEADRFHTSARNFLDHDVVGNSGIFVPLTDLGAIISGTEVSVRSPHFANIAQLRLAYSNQIAQGIGPITGGLLEFAAPGNFLLDHDQRNTASAVLTLNLPGRMWMAPAYEFGSGFLNGDGPAHLPPHSTVDLSLGKKFGERWTISANATNLGDSRYLLDTSNTFGGTHVVNPRQIYAELRYRFHF
ncbi:MAG: TonB-dependent receptor [Acidobacteriaceae bacterium]|nr:TonB-dependent receptor [Acidobacteriaceae bacterium]